MFVGLAGAGAVSRMLWEFLNGDFIRHLETKLKILRHLGNHSLKIFFIREAVIRAVHTDGLEHLGVFGQAVFLKAQIVKFPGIAEARFIVENPAPAWIFPE